LDRQWRFILNFGNACGKMDSQGPGPQDPAQTPGEP
jgi:hypothetical protein